MAAIRPEVHAFTHTAQALLLRAAFDPLSIEEAGKIAGCLQRVAETLQIDESHHNSK